MDNSRYGGVFTGSDGGGNLNTSIIGLYLLLSFCVAALLTAESAFVFVGLYLLLIFIGFGSLVKGGVTSGIRGERFRQHLENARRFFDTGDINRLRESVRRARIYGDIPRELDYLEDEEVLSSRLKVRYNNDKRG